MQLSTNELKNVVAGILGVMDYAERVAALPDCNTCGKVKACEYLPKPGESVRINCPLWEQPGQIAPPVQQGAQE